MELNAGYASEGSESSEFAELRDWRGTSDSKECGNQPYLTLG
jgi:hypothetical protein